MTLILKHAAPDYDSFVLPDKTALTRMRLVGNHALCQLATGLLLHRVRIPPHSRGTGRGHMEVFAALMRIDRAWSARRREADEPHMGPCDTVRHMQFHVSPTLVSCKKISSDR